MEPRWYNAVLPFVTVILTAFIGMYVAGYDAIQALPAADRPVMSLINVFSNSDSVSALIWASTLGWLVSLTLVLAQRMMSLHTALEAWIGGICEVIEPTIVLLLAWALGDVIAACQTAPYIASALGDHLPVHLLPFIATLMAYIISFATGSGAGP